MAAKSMQLQRLRWTEDFAIAMNIETANWNGVSTHLAAFSGLIGDQRRIELQRGGFTRR
jgi:hypothetical protein